ncbi:MAG TPA: hypothetical protein PK675_03980 [Clostridia bacterium]|nr:hypothetical protein [Clostridia bacterium]
MLKIITKYKSDGISLTSCGSIICLRQIICSKVSVTADRAHIDKIEVGRKRQKIKETQYFMSLSWWKYGRLVRS